MLIIISVAILGVISGFCFGFRLGHNDDYSRELSESLEPIEAHSNEIKALRDIKEQFAGLKPASELVKPADELGEHWAEAKHTCFRGNGKVCKHWIWDINNGNWLNTLTGETQEDGV